MAAFTGIGRSSTRRMPWAEKSIALAGVEKPAEPRTVRVTVWYELIRGSRRRSIWVLSMGNGTFFKILFGQAGGRPHLA